MKTKIQIRNWITSNVIFEYTCENNTIKTTVEEAVKQGVSLQYADLTFANLENANLSNANLVYADLTFANLENANLSNANLVDADLSNANLVDADLSNANLNNTYLNVANLKNANLIGVNLEFADLNGANLEYANIENADLTKAILRYANLENAKIDYPMVCPETGSFIGWKKVRNNCYSYLIKLEIPVDAKRSSATTKKCRCEFAKVLEIINLENNVNVNEVINFNYISTTYKVNEMVYPDSWDDCRWHECSNGIHFFMDKQDAINYN